MNDFIQDVINSLLLFSALGAMQGLADFMGKKATDAYKFGPMSYSKFTQMLISEEGPKVQKRSH